MKSSNRRASRGGGNFRDEAEEYDAAITNLADFAREIIDKVNARLANTPREERWIKRMAAALDLRAMAFPTGAVANSLASVAALVAADIVSIAAVGLATGARIQVTLPAQSISVSSHLISSDQIPSHRMRSESDISDPTQCHAILSHLLLWIQVRVSEAGEPELWWAAGVGGPATGAGGHGVIIVYDAWPLHGHVNITTSRACFNSCGQTLLDVDELATWQWRRADVPPVAPPPALQPPAAPPLAVPMVPRPPAAVAAHAVTAAANASAALRTLQQPPHCWEETQLPQPHMRRYSKLHGRSRSRVSPHELRLMHCCYCRIGWQLALTLGLPPPSPPPRL